MKDFYYLHLGKTSGRFFRTYVLSELIKLSNDTNTRYLWPETDLEDWTHHGWHNLISDETYLICSLRDPVEVAVSYIMHHGGIKDKNDLFNQMAMHDNIQSKGFITWENNIVQFKSKVDFDKDLILSRLKRVDLVIDSKDINIKNYNTIKKKIASDISMPFVSYLEKEDTLDFKTPGVKELCESLTEEEIEIIKSINYMDVELYKAAKGLFFPI